MNKKQQNKNQYFRPMKSRRFLALSLSIIMMLPFFTSCLKRGANDPWLSFKTRNSRISAVWTLQSGYYDRLYNLEEEFRWVDDDCEDVDGAQEEYKEEDTETKAFNFSDALVHYEKTYTTTRDYVDEAGYGQIQGKEYEDGHTIKRDVNFNYELTIKKNGTYKIYVTYNLFEDDYPQPDDQYGLVFGGTFEYTDEWHWTDNSLGTAEGIQFDGFPFPVITEKAKYDPVNFVVNYVNNFQFENVSRIFELDKLESKEMTLQSMASENKFYKEKDNEFTALTNSGDEIDCEGTFSLTERNSENFFLNFSSDGKSVDE